MSLTAEQEQAFTAWHETASVELYWPDANNIEDVTRAAFEAGVRAAENVDTLRYAAQYRRRFLGGARDAERHLREAGVKLARQVSPPLAQAPASPHDQKER